MFQHFISILDAAIDCDDYFKISLYYPDSSCLEQEKICGCPNVQLVAGAMRAALIDEQYDWICKWDFCEDARGSACERELRRYQVAKKWGVEEFFTPVVYLGKYIRDYIGYDVEPWDFREEDTDSYSTRNYHIELELYAYRKVRERGIWGCYHKLDAHDRDFLSKTRGSSPLYGRSEDVAAAFLLNYGAVKYTKLNEFCSYCDINDLHGGNVGWLNGDKLVIMDYGGYYDDVESEDENVYTSDS